MTTLIATTTPYNNKMTTEIKSIIDELILKVIRKKRILMRITSDGPVYADDRYVYYPDGSTLDLQEPDANESDSDDELTESESEKEESEEEESDLEIMQSHGYALPDDKKTPEQKPQSLKRSRDTEQEIQSPKRPRMDDSMYTNYGTDPDEMEEDAQMRLDDIDEDIMNVFKDDIIEDYIDIDDLDDDINLESGDDWYF